MTTLDAILDGLERELELERELGVRQIACDRALLAPPERKSAAVAEPPPVAKPVAREPVAKSVVREPVSREPVAPRRNPSSPRYDFVFLHERRLSADAVTMMAKIVSAMGKTAETAPVIFEGERPVAKVFIALGAGALAKWFPGTRGSSGAWLTTSDGEQVLVSQSPETILRISPQSPDLRKIKGAMWASLKSVLQRIR